MVIQREKYGQAVPGRISWRAILVGLLLLPINAYWMAITEIVWGSLRFTSGALQLNVVFILLFLILINRLIKLISPNSALSPRELLTIYIILAASSSMSGYDNMGSLLGVFSHAFWYDTLENDWAALFHKDIPEWLVVSDERAMRGFYRGGESFFTAGNIRNWLHPILMWSAFIVLLITVMLLVNAIIRKQWTEREKLVYPIIQLPLEMTSEKSRFFSNLG